MLHKNMLEKHLSLIISVIIIFALTTVSKPIEVNAATTTNISTWSSLKTYIEGKTSGTYIINLTANLSATSMITVKSSANITIKSDSTKRTISRAQSYHLILFKVSSRATLNFENIKITGSANANNNGGYSNKDIIEMVAKDCVAGTSAKKPVVPTNSSIKFYGGNNNTSSVISSPIHCNGGKFTLGEDAEICDSLIYNASGGGAIRADNGANVAIYGKIYNCGVTPRRKSDTGGYSYDGEGGAIWLYSNNSAKRSYLFVGSTAEIYNCYTGAHSGAIEIVGYADCKFEGTIHDCIAHSHAGGIFVHGNATFTMTGGSIYNCQATAYCTEWVTSIPFGSGGGIFNDGIADISSNASIYKNSAQCNGGGIYCTEYSTTTLNNAGIYDNTAVENGGGIYNLGIVNMKGNSFVTSNTATNNGTDNDGNKYNSSGIYQAATLNVSDRVNISADNPVYLEKDGEGTVHSITVTGTLTAEKVASINSYYTNLKTNLVEVTGGYTNNEVTQELISKFSETALSESDCGTCGTDINECIDTKEPVLINQNLTDKKYIWITRHYNVEYFSNDESYDNLLPTGNMDKQIKHNDETLTLSENSFLSKSYTFKYFTTEPSISAELYYDGTGTMNYTENADLKLYAQWEVGQSNMGIILQKAFSDDTGDFSKIKFTLTSLKDETEFLVTLSGENGVYIFNKNGVVTELSLKSDGTLIIDGLGAGIYHITEIETDEMHIPLSEPITVRITEVYSSDGTIIDFTATVNDKKATVKDGFIILDVENEAIIKPPETGGTGAIFIVEMGVCLIILSIIGFILYMRKLNKGRL